MIEESAFFNDDFYIKLEKSNYSIYSRYFEIQNAKNKLK